jgi:tryptophan 2,3-dioxygenase
MPFASGKNYWQDVDQSFWKLYRDAYVSSLSEAEQQNVGVFDSIFIDDAKYPEDRAFSADASRHALFIMLYRDYPLLQLPYELLSTLMEVDESLSMWRHRHIHMVQRTIGKRVGTGGSTGAEYLRGAADSHYIFKELTELTSFLLPRHMLPQLPKSVVDALSYKA